ncbi:pyrroline-5-carboxylate reductase [Methylotenera versatilis]|uniref:pyrroline-5-carboxylate reductase n=1 Tax=Methylotenera versatilis TaxID=1055487 RepID=UPI0006480FE3|nr:pyrroline-5-carboxylate reductase [Methylotenera versatilis]
MKLAFIGGGNMAYALIVGLKNRQVVMSNILVIERDASKWGQLEQLGVQVSAELADVSNYDVIVLAIKPQQLPALAKTLAPILTTQLVISIAAGIRLGDLSRWLDNYPTIIRAMPNTPAQIQEGVTGLYALPDVSEKHIALADQILKAAGSTLWLDSEEKLDAVTAISGSGPAYVFYLIEALQTAALELGLSDDEAKQLSIATFKGASLLADASTTPIDILRTQVTSKGGTTEQGLLSLENSQVKQAITLAAQKAYQRAKTLGDELGQD